MSGDGTSASLPDVAIVGPSKTGTTGLLAAIREGLADAAGGRAYALNEREDLAQIESLQRRAPDVPLVGKFLLTSVDYDDALLGAFDRHLMTVRDPRDTLVSVALYYPLKALNDGVDAGALEDFVALVERKEADPAAVSFLEVFAAVHRLLDRHVNPERLPLRRFRRAIQHADRHDPFVVSYERFVADDLSDLSEHLGVKVRNTRPNDYAALVLRSGGSGDWRRWLTPSDVDLLRPQLRPYLERFGYEDEWELEEHPELDPETGSGYIRSALSRRRHQLAHTAVDGTPDEGSDERMRLLRDRAELGAGAAATRLAGLLLERDADGDLEEAIELLEFGAASGGRRAMRRLAQLRATGPERVVDLREARRWRLEADLEHRLRRSEQWAAKAREEAERPRPAALRAAGRVRTRVTGALARAVREGPAGWLRLPVRAARALRVEARRVLRAR